MPKIKPVSLDGSTLEGGGQLVRVALSISAITGKPLHIYNIRANRAPNGRHNSQAKHSVSKGSAGRRDQKKSGSANGNVKIEGGLKESHLAAEVWLGQHVGALIEGGGVGSRELTFIPGIAKPLDLDDQNTIKLVNPGSVFLIWQAIFPYLVFRSRLKTPSQQGFQSAEATEEVCLTLHGGTNVPKSMSAEYVSQVFTPVLSRLGFPAPKIEVVKRGWAGSAPQIGEVKITVPQRGPTYRLPIHFRVDSRGEITKIDVSVIAYPDTARDEVIATLSKKIAESCVGLVSTEPEIEVVLNEDSGDERRLYILLVAHTSNGWILGRDFLGSGRRAKSTAEARKIIDEACTGVVKELVMEIKRGGCVDEYMSDQLGVFQALTACCAGRAGSLQGESGISVVNSGEWKADRGKGAADMRYIGDDSGSLHARTVRWVCETMMKEIRFTPGGTCSRVLSTDEPPDLGNLALEDDE